MSKKQNKTIYATDEGRLAHLGSLALDETEKRLRDGSISSQLLTVLLKNLTAQTLLTIEKLRADTEFVQAKTQTIGSSDEFERIAKDARDAMMTYKGGSDNDH